MVDGKRQEAANFRLVSHQLSAKLAECRGLAPLARRHALVSTEARSACPVGIPKWCWRSGRRTCGLTHEPAYRLTGTASARFRFRPNGARGRTCTCTIEDLSFAPLHWATRAMRLVPTAGFAPTLRAF